MSAAPFSIPQQFEEAMAAHRAGDLAAAMAGYEHVLALDPAHFDALHLLGVALLQCGRAPRAIEILERALAVHPDAYPALFQLAAAHRATGQNEAAATLLARVIALAPDYMPAREAHAFALHALGRLAEAADEFAVIAQMLPDSASAQNNLGTTLGQLGMYAQALKCYERALAISPHDPDAMLNAAQVEEKLGHPLAATERFNALLARCPDRAPAWYRAGCHFYVQGMRDEAMRAFAKALTIDPEYVEARWELAIAELPLAYGLHEEPANHRRRFANALSDLDAWFDDKRAQEGQRAVGTRQPFYLAFHDVNNVDLLTRYGDLCQRLMLAAIGKLPIPPRRRATHGPVRLAVVCGHIYDQSVWTALVRGWCAHLDADRVSVHLFHTGAVSDAETAIARARAASFHSNLASVSDWISAIRSIEPDVILYPEIGMDAMCAKLASLRLAPIQAVAWGHPETSGLPTIDYFFSAAAFEPPGAQANYRERLVALPNLGCYYDYLNPPESQPDWGRWHVDRSIPSLVCAATPYKYFPEHDHVLVEIALRLGRCQFFFFEDMAPRLSRRIEERLATAFHGVGLDSSRFVRFLPRQSRPAFFSLMRQSDVYLDTIGFSGFNTVMQAVECALPVVTLEGRFMRGRLGSGILRRMGMDELVVTDTRTYVDGAVRLCQDAAYRRDIGMRMVAQSDILFRDLTPVRALEDFLVAAVFD